MGIINLFGASGHAKVIMDIIIARGDTVKRLYDDAPHCNSIHGIPAFKSSDVQISGPMIVSIGSNKFRKQVAERYDVEYAKAIHPTAIISQTSIIKGGTVVMQGAIVQSDVEIGRHCIINTGASIDHECKISDYVHVSPHATLCGNVQVGEGCWIGAGAIIIPGVKIGNWCTIGAGSVVLKDIPDGATAYGNPCRIKKIDMQLVENQQLKMGGGDNRLSLTRLAA